MPNILRVKPNFYQTVFSIMNGIITSAVKKFFNFFEYQSEVDDQEQSDPNGSDYFTDAGEEPIPSDGNISAIDDSHSELSDPYSEEETKNWIEGSRDAYNSDGIEGDHSKSDSAVTYFYSESDSELTDDYSGDETKNSNKTTHLNISPSQADSRLNDENQIRHVIATPSEAWRYSIGKISCLARIPIYVVGSAILMAKILIKLPIVLVKFDICDDNTRISEVEKDLSEIGTNCIMLAHLAKRTIASVVCIQIAPPKDYDSLDRAFDLTKKVVLLGTHYDALNPSTEKLLTMKELLATLTDEPFIWP